MSKKEMHFLWILIGLIVVLTTGLAFAIMVYFDVEKAEPFVKLETNQETEEKQKDPISPEEESEIFKQFSRRVAALEVGPAHEALQVFVESNFIKGKTYTELVFSDRLRPEIEAYFQNWTLNLVEQVLMDSGRQGDEVLKEQLYSRGVYTEKVDFMLLYERQYLKKKGVVIVEGP